MLPLVASPQSEQSVAAPLEVAHAEADGEFDGALPDDADPGLATRVRRPTRFYGESSSDYEANSGSSDGSDSSCKQRRQRLQAAATAVLAPADIDSFCTG